MREYEIVYIFRSSFTSEEIDAKLERYHALITSVDAGQITAVEQWGKRQLAYPIDKEPNGFYVVAQFTSDPSALPELERTLKLDDDLLRYLIVLSEGELPIPPSLREERDAAARRAAAEQARQEEAKATAESEAAEDAEATEESEAAEEPETAAPAEADESSDAEAVEGPDASADAETSVAEEPAAEAEADAGDADAEASEPTDEKED